MCACVYTVDICVFLWGAGEAASGASDWPTGTGAGQDADWIHVWRQACRFFLCAMLLCLPERWPIAPHIGCITD